MWTWNIDWIEICILSVYFLESSTKTNVMNPASVVPPDHHQRSPSPEYRLITSNSISHHPAPGTDYELTWCLFMGLLKPLSRTHYSQSLVLPRLTFLSIIIFSIGLLCLTPDCFSCFWIACCLALTLLLCYMDCCILCLLPAPITRLSCYSAFVSSLITLLLLIDHRLYNCFFFN